MLIRIIKGCYSYVPALPNGKKSPYTIPIRPGHAPVEVSDADGEALIASGIAESVEAEGQTTPADETQEEPSETVSEPIRKKRKAQTSKEDVTE